jgi:hypothetical protein
MKDTKTKRELAKRVLNAPAPLAPRAEVIDPDEHALVLVKQIAARQLSLMNERLSQGQELQAHEAKTIQALTTSLVNVKNLRKGSEDDLSELSDEELENLWKETREREHKEVKALEAIVKGKK